MKNNVLTSNQKYFQPSCDGNGSSRTYDYVIRHMSFIRMKNLSPNIDFIKKQCIMNINQSIRLKLCCCVQSVCNEMFINIIDVSVVWKWLHWTLSEEQNLYLHDLSGPDMHAMTVVGSCHWYGWPLNQLQVWCLNLKGFNFDGMMLFSQS